MQLYNHQKKILDDDFPKHGIFLQTGGGKTRVALSLARGTTLVVAPKTQVLDGNWEREYKKMGATFPLTVMSKEAFRRDNKTLRRYDTLIIDEAHTVAGVTPFTRSVKRVERPKASQLWEAVMAYIERTKPARIYPVTATPIRSPMSVWALARILGKTWDFYEFRKAFYTEVRMPGRSVWMPNKSQAAKERLGRVVASIGWVGQLSDWFDVPEQIDRTMYCPLSKEQEEAIDLLPLEYPMPLTLVGKTHEAEQGMSKVEKIEELREEFGKVLVFARYTAQIDAIHDHFLKKGIPAFTLTGKTKDRAAFVRAAEAMVEGVAIVQSSIAAGFELPSISCVIFASCDWSIVNYTQARGRVLRANALKRNLNVHLVSGDVDRAVLKALQDKQDFTEKMYITNKP